MPSEATDKRLPLLNRLQDPESKHFCQTLLERIQPMEDFILSPTHNQQDTLTQQISPKNKTQGDNGLSPSLRIFKTERSLGSRPMQTFSKNSMESQSLSRKRKTPPSASSAPKSTQRKLDLTDISLCPNPAPKPSLLSRIDVEMRSLETIQEQRVKMSLKQRATSTNLGKSLDYLSQKCLGTHTVDSLDQALVPPARRLSNFSEFTTETSKNVNSSSASHQECLTTSPRLSGNIFSRENPSTSTKSCLLSTRLRLLKTGRLKLE